MVLRCDYGSPHPAKRPPRNLYRLVRGCYLSRTRPVPQSVLRVRLPPLHRVHDDRILYRPFGGLLVEVHSLLVRESG